MSRSYRDSHASSGYGEIYKKTYEEGYYASQWDEIERPILERLFRDAKAKGARSYFDFACGTGRILSVGERYFDCTTGADVSEAMLSVASKVCQKSKILKTDITKNQIEERFDVITAFRFFLNSENELSELVLESLRKMMKDDGFFIANIHVNKLSPLGCIYRLRNFLKREVVANTMGYQEFEELLKKHGFSVEKVCWYSYLPRIGWHFGPISKRLMLPVEKIFEKIPFLSKVLAQSFVVVARRC